MTLARRASHGEKIWQAHRSHGYQKLVLLGWSHRRVAVWSYLLMLACGIAAMLLDRMVIWLSLAGVAVAVAIMIMLLLSIEAVWERDQVTK